MTSIYHVSFYYRRENIPVKIYANCIFKFNEFNHPCSLNEYLIDYWEKNDTTSYDIEIRGIEKNR